SAKSCWAVGDVFAQTGGAHHTFAEHWNGSAWTHVASPNPAGTTRNQLFGVACPTATQCVAVGGASDNQATSGSTLAEVLSGSAWHLATAANPVPADVATLNGVA